MLVMELSGGIPDVLRPCPHGQLGEGFSWPPPRPHQQADEEVLLGLSCTAPVSGSLLGFWRCWGGGSSEEGHAPRLRRKKHGQSPRDLVSGLGPNMGSCRVALPCHALEQEGSSLRSERLLASSITITVIQLGQKLGRGVPRSLINLFSGIFSSLD